MTKAVIEMAREAGLYINNGIGDEEYVGTLEDIEHFAALVRAEREWVDLTEDEIFGCLLKWRQGEYELQIASAVIAKFKEKQL